MILDISIFKEAIQVLKTNTIDNVNDSLDSLTLHRDLVKGDYAYQLKELKHILVHYKKYESQTAFRAQSINLTDIQPWIPLLKKHQEASVYQDVKVAIVTQITDARKELEGIGYSLEELRLRVVEQARKAKQASNAILKVEKQVFVLETALDINDFFSETRYKATEIADFEIGKYYDIYRKGRS